VGVHQRPLGGLRKRAVDIVFASLALVVFAPIMLMVAILVRVLLGAPILSAHQRVGFDGRSFSCFRFRTMGVDAAGLVRPHLTTDPVAAEQWPTARKLLDDPRIDCLGHVLRTSGLNELPQLFNVLRGDMSAVGPCPVVADELDRYGRHARDYCTARPGLTGLWQISGRNRLSYAARARLDRYYVRRWSLWLDLIVLLKTIRALLSFEETA
jgi:exopolysaccharide production protein ExoY